MVAVRVAPKGRISSLLLWGLLVGGVALAMTFPLGSPRVALTPGLLPAAFLFLLAGLVFGLSHPEGRAWVGAALLGWVPVVAGLAGIMDPDPVRSGPAGWVAVLLLPAALAAAGAWAGTWMARRRGDGR